VLYGGNRWAVARTALVLMYAGVEDVRWLVGGKGAWKADGYPFETGQNIPKTAAAFGGAPPHHPEYVVNLEQVHAMLSDPKAVVADARTWDEHTGQVSGYSYIHAKGRIPGSIWIGEIPSKALTEGGPTTSRRQVLQACREVTAGWREKGVTPDRHIAFYCGTGWRASEAFWYAHLMGWEHISVYDGGWLEWSSQTENKL
jgi:thiosulfate/3-mercaptopyruvate sulfurtransferase